MRVSNMRSPRGNNVPNQFIITDEELNETWFQSYKSMIAKECDKGTFLDSTYWNYSKTTSKYLSMFLGVSCTEIKKRVASGEYMLADLNG